MVSDRDRIGTLTEEAHALARGIVEAERLARAHEYHGRYTRAAAAMVRRECIVDQRFLMLRELFLERQVWDV